MFLFHKLVISQSISSVNFKIKFQFAVLLLSDSLRASFHRWKLFSLYEPCECVDEKSDYEEKSGCKICGVST